MGNPKRQLNAMHGHHPVIDIGGQTASHQIGLDHDHQTTMCDINYSRFIVLKS